MADMFNSRESILYAACIANAFTKSLFEDLWRLLHFVDDWEGAEGNDDDNEFQNAEQHRRKTMIEEAFAKRWTSLMKAPEKLCGDEN